MITVVLLRRRAAIAALLMISMVAAAGVPAADAGSRQSRQPRLDNQLRAELDAGNRSEKRVIVRVRPGAGSTLRQALTDHGDRVVAEHSSIDALTAVVHGDDLETLAQREDVLSVSTDAVVRPHLLGGLLGGVLNLATGLLLPSGADTSGAAVSPSVLRSTLGVGSSSWSGRGVGVAVIDSGLDPTLDFQGRVKAFYDFTRGGIQTTAYDDNGHGTHIAGTIGSAGTLSTDRAYRGLAPNVSFVIFKVLDRNGSGFTSDVIRAVDFAVDNRAALGIDVINLSLGHPIFEPAATDPLVQAVERATRAGIIVVAAAGNFGKNAETGKLGYAGITSPGNAPSAITVGAVRTEDTVGRKDDRIADYSSSGPTWYDGFVKPDLVAPGHNIIAAAARRGTLYQTYPELKASDGDYMRLSGTSMATAVTTGTIALLVEANRSANGYPSRPSLTPNAVKAVLQYTSVDVRDAKGVKYEPLRMGAGELNGKGAIDLGRAINTAAETGQSWLTSTPYPWTRIGGQDLAWNQAVVWGNAIIWGADFLYNERAWGSAIIWGADTTWTEAIIWGANLVWTDPQAWANAIIWGADTIGVANDDAIIWGATGGLTPETTAWRSLDGVAGGSSATVAGYSTVPR